MSKPILVCHVLYRLDYGGLENGVVNIINALPADRWQHKIVCLAGRSDFSKRLRADVEIIDCPKQPGQDPGLYWRLWKLFRAMKPRILHTRNLSTLEAQAAAWAAGVPVRIHGEHGHDVHDIANTRRRYRWMRKVFAPLITQYVTVSRLLEQHLLRDIHITPERVTRICNGVDTERFKPTRSAARPALADAPFAASPRLVVGTIGRMQPVKDQLTLARAFISLIQARPDLRQRLALVMVGDGPLRAEVARLLADAGCADISWLPGTRDDTPALLNAFDLFVLPSLAEGISNTVLEAMATGLPVIATDVGGNPELVNAGTTGMLVPGDNPHALAEAIACYVDDPALLERHGSAGRQRACRELSLAHMIAQYGDVYARCVEGSRP